MGLYDYVRCDVHSWIYHLFKPMNEKNFATIKKYAKVAGKTVLVLFVLFVAVMNFGSLDNARMKR